MLCACKSASSSLSSASDAQLHCLNLKLCKKPISLRVRIQFAGVVCACDSPPARKRWTLTTGLSLRGRRESGRESVLGSLDKLVQLTPFPPPSGRVQLAHWRAKFSGAKLNFAHLRRSRLCPLSGVTTPLLAADLAPAHWCCLSKLLLSDHLLVASISSGLPFPRLLSLSITF